MTDKTDIAALVVKLLANAHLNRCWDRFEPGMEPPAPFSHAQTCRLETEAADLLTSLAEERERMRGALEPFAEARNTLSSRWQEHEEHWQGALFHPLKVADLTRARAALAPTPASKESLT